MHTEIERRAIELIHNVMDERGLKHRRFHDESVREDSFALEALCRALEIADEIDEDLQEARALHRRDFETLQICIEALIKISEPRVGGGRWAAAIANEALDKMTCAGEADGDQG